MLPGPRPAAATARPGPVRRLVAGFVLQSTAQPNREQERHASWLELFLDLVFVLALDAVGNRLNPGAPRAPEVAVAFGLFLLVQWAWVGQVYYDNRYDPDDTLHRLLVLVAVLAGAALALGVEDAPNTLLLPIGYLLIRGLLLLLYLRAWLSGGPARRVTSVYLTGFGAGWLLWLGSLALPAGVRPVVWITAFVIELATPWLGFRRLSAAPVDVSHLPERFGQFIILLLGINVARMLAAVPPKPGPEMAAGAAIAFVIPASVWWVYTTFVSTPIQRRGLLSGTPYTYIHGLLGAGLLFLGWSLGQVVGHITQGPPALPVSLRVLLGMSLDTWVICGLGLNWILTQAVPRRRMAIAGFGLCSVTLVVGAVSDAVTMTGLLAVAVASYAVLITRFISGTIAPAELNR